MLTDVAVIAPPKIVPPSSGERPQAHRVAAQVQLRLTADCHVGARGDVCITYVPAVKKSATGAIAVVDNDLLYAVPPRLRQPRIVSGGIVDLDAIEARPGQNRHFGRGHIDDERVAARAADESTGAVGHQRVVADPAVNG